MARLIVILCFILANVLIVVDFLNVGRQQEKPRVHSPMEVKNAS